jgi:hypothetical protein
MVEGSAVSESCARTCSAALLAQINKKRLAARASACSNDFPGDLLGVRSMEEPGVILG